MAISTTKDQKLLVDSFYKAERGFYSAFEDPTIICMSVVAEELRV